MRFTSITNKKIENLELYDANSRQSRIVCVRKFFKIFSLSDKSLCVVKRVWLSIEFDVRGEKGVFLVWWFGERGHYHSPINWNDEWIYQTLYFFLLVTSGGRGGKKKRWWLMNNKQSVCAVFYRCLERFSHMWASQKKSKSRWEVHIYVYNGIQSNKSCTQFRYVESLNIFIIERHNIKLL